MSPRKTALNICAAAAVLAFALGAQGDNNSTPPPASNQHIDARGVFVLPSLREALILPSLREGAGVGNSSRATTPLFTLPSLREGAGVGNSSRATPLPRPFPEGRENTGELRDILIRRANGEEFDMREWLAIRRLRFYENAEHAFANSISQTAMQLSFVKRARVDLQTSLGGRKGAGGVDVAGALRETDGDIVGWQLRGYAAEHGAKGLNTGLFYRRVVGGALAGVNVFADYEDGDDGDFWRWSVGGDVKNRFGELSANRYFAITDAQVVGNENTYTREGYDVDVAVRIPRLEWAKARVGYYDFKGEFGDEDENGFRAGLDLSPGAGLVVGVEYDDDDGKFGGNISYTHNFGETQQGAQRAGEFEPRAHFYDSVRREYSQRISRTSGGANGFVIVTTAAAIEVTSAMAAGTMSVTVTAGAVNSVFAFADTVNVGKASGVATIKHQGDAWTLALSSAAAELAFLGGTVMNVSSGVGSFYRVRESISEVVMGGTVITLLGTRFDFEADGNGATITLHEGGLAIPPGVSGISVQYADMATVVVGGVTVNCASGATMTGVSGKCEIANATSEIVVATVTADVNANDVLIGRITLAGMGDGISANVTPTAEFAVTNINSTVFHVSLLAAAAMSADVNDKIARVTVGGGTLQTAREFLFTVSVNPLSITLDFVGNANTAPVTTGGGITIGTLEVTNGFNAQNINFVGARGDFRLENVDNAPNRRLLILGGNNNNERAATVVLRGDDNAGGTDAALLSVTVSVVERVVLNGGGRVTVFAAADENEVVAVFQPVGGFPPYNNLNKLLPSGVLPGGFQESAAAASVTITRTNTDLTAGDEHIIAYEVTETRDGGGDSASATVTVTVIASLNAAVDFAGGALTAGMAATVATISAAGGIGDYTFSANNNAVSFVDGTIAVANFNNAGTVSVNLIANDDAAITEPFTVVITLTALNTATAAPDNATFREFQTGASVTLANLTYSGGGDNVTATVITVQNGEGDVDGGALLVSSDMRGTAEVKVAVYDSANAAAPQSTLTLSLEFVAPLTAVFADSPNFMPLTNTAAHITIATVAISGGNGDYQSPSLQVNNTRDFAWSEGTILILNNTGGRNESARTVTALIVADDNSEISEQASLSVSVNVVERVLLNGGGRYSVYAVNAESAPVVVFEPAGGTPPYGMQVAVEPMNLPAGFSRQNNISATITRTTANAVGGMEHEFIQEITETRTNGDTARATATITVIAPISASYELSVTTTIEVNMGNEPSLTVTVEVGDLSIGIMQTVATISAAGGVGSYVFSDNHNDVSFVDGSVMVANFANHATVTVDVVIDDRENGNAIVLTPPLTISVSLTASPPIMPVTAAPLPIISLTIGVNYGATPNTPAFTIMASGGKAPLKCAVSASGIPSYRDQPILAWAVFQYRAESCVYYFRNGAIPANAPTSGITEEEGFIVEDSSTPPLRYFVRQISVQFVASQ